MMRLNEGEGWDLIVLSLNSCSSYPLPALFLPSNLPSPLPLHPPSLWVTFGMRGQRCVPTGWPFVMRRQVSGWPGSALSASPGNTNSDGSKAHRNSCKAAVLCAPTCSYAHLSFHGAKKEKSKQEANLLDWCFSSVGMLSRETLPDLWEHAGVWKLI